MANEAVQVEGPYEVHDFTVSESVLIEKLTVCQLTSPRTASASSAADLFAGIAATEKVASNGKTELGLFTTGTFLLANAGSGTIPDGALVSLSGANLIKQATEAEMVTGAAFGKALQDIAAAGTGEVKIGALG